jgi:hypothetical protein
VEADSINGLLDQTAGIRAVVTPELSSLTTGCDTVDPETAVTDLRAAISVRMTVLRRLPSTPTAALPDGSGVRGILVRAMTASVHADRDYLSWVEGLAQDGCSSTQDPDLTAGNNISTGQATPAKAEFVSKWNPIATANGLPTRDAGDL